MLDRGHGSTTGPRFDPCVPRFGRLGRRPQGPATDREAQEGRPRHRVRDRRLHHRRRPAELDGDSRPRRWPRTPHQPGRHARDPCTRGGSAMCRSRIHPIERADPHPVAYTTHAVLTARPYPRAGGSPPRARAALRPRSRRRSGGHCKQGAKPGEPEGSVRDKIGALQPRNRDGSPPVRPRTRRGGAGSTPPAGNHGHDGMSRVDLRSRIHASSSSGGSGMVKKYPCAVCAPHSDEVQRGFVLDAFHGDVQSEAPTDRVDRPHDCGVAFVVRHGSTNDLSIFTSSSGSTRATTATRIRYRSRRSRPHAHPVQLRERIGTLHGVGHQLRLGDLDRRYVRRAPIW